MTSHKERQPADRERRLALAAQWVTRVVLAFVSIALSPVILVLAVMVALLFLGLANWRPWGLPLALAGLLLWIVAIARGAPLIGRAGRRIWASAEVKDASPLATTPDAVVSRSAVATWALSMLLWVVLLAGLAIFVGALDTPTSLLTPRFGQWAAWLTPSIVVLTVALVIIGRGALLQIRRSSGRLWGAPAARSAIAVAAAAGVFGLIGLLFSPLLLRGMGAARKAMCQANVKNMALAVQMYLADYSDVFPPAGMWCDATAPYIRNRAVYVCPEMRGLPCGYGFNAALNSLPMHRLVDPQYTIVIFETDVGWNATGQLERLRDPPRHLGGDSFGFADGHGQWVGRRQLLDDKGATYRFYPNIIPPPAAADVEGD
jgi:hypothetical protein